MREPDAIQQDWSSFRARVLAEPLICFGMTVREAELHDAESVAPLLGDAPPLPSGGREPTPVGNLAFARHLIREGALLVVEDDERRPMGLVSLRRAHLGRVLAGWRLDERRLGKGLSAILVEGVAERLLSAGAEVVRFQVPPGARAARRLLETLGFGVWPGGARPLDYEADAAMFAARARRGTALLPTPAERRRGPSPGEQGLVERGGDRHPRRIAEAVLARAFASPVIGEGIRLDRPERYDIDEIASLVPTPPGSDAPRDAEVLRGLVREALDRRNLVVAADPESGPFGSLTVRALRDGAIEIGWHVLPERRGEGLATRMAAMAAERLFASGSERIACTMDPENTASLRVAQRIGFAPSLGDPVVNVRYLSLTAADLVRLEPVASMPVL